jgi:hypothetical protein
MLIAEKPFCVLKDKRFGDVAQRSEQRTHNPLVLGSNPSVPSTDHARTSLGGRVEPTESLRMSSTQREAGG